MRNILDFEKNIADLQDKITKLRESGSEKSSLIEVNEQIEQIKLKIDTYKSNQLPDVLKKIEPIKEYGVEFVNFFKILKEKNNCK